MGDFGAEFARALAATEAIEWAGAALGLAYVVLAIRQHRGCWLAAFASTAIYLHVFAQAGLYLQAALQGFFLAMAVYGWHAWRTGADRPSLRISRAGWRVQVGGLAGVAVATGASAWLLMRTDGAVRPWLDAATAWASVFATWLVARKKLESWAWWFVVNAAMVVLCWQQGLYPTALLYACFLALVVLGWRTWHADWRRGAPP